MADAPSFDIKSLPIKRLQGHRERVRCLAWNADGRRLASGSADKTLRIWVPDKDAKSGTEIKGMTSEVTGVKWDPTHPEHLASCSAASSAASGTLDRGVYFWDIRQAKPTSVVQTEGQNINMTYSPDGKTVVVGNRNDLITWIDVDTKTIVRTLKTKSEANESIFSHNGSLLLTAYDGNVQIATHPAGDIVHTVNVSTVSTTTLDLDPRGRYLLAGSNDATLTLWETSEWTCVQSMGYHEEPIRSCSFSFDGQFVASAAGVNEVQIVRSLLQSRRTNGPCDVIAWHPSKMILAYAAEELEGGRASGAFRLDICTFIVPQEL